MSRSLFTGIWMLFLFCSCTMILSTNVPGKSERSLPREWWGKYEAITESRMPDKRDAEKTERNYVTIDSNRISWQSTDETKTYSLNDSLRYSVIYGQSRYLSLLMPEGLYAVFKVVKNADTLELYSLSSDNDEMRKADLSQYFSKVEKIKTPADEYYRVTIVEKKLDAYFKSGIPSKDATRLVPVK